MSTRREVFQHIYEVGAWGGGSGPGSDPANSKPYLDFLRQFISANSIKSVLDIGCGDMRIYGDASDFWRGLWYAGVDLCDVRVPSAHHLPFIATDACEASFSADLIIVKDVLAHLSDYSIWRLVISILQGSPRAIIFVSDQTSNVFDHDIPDGGYRPNLNLAKFVPQAQFAMCWPSGAFNKAVYVWRAA